MINKITGGEQEEPILNRRKKRDVEEAHEQLLARHRREVMEEVTEAHTEGGCVAECSPTAMACCNAHFIKDVNNDSPM